ncbi:MAG: type II secretion system F family protein [Bacteroidota bacterium]
MGFKLDQQLTSSFAENSQKDSWEQLLKKEIHLFGAFFNGKRKEAFYTELAILLNAGIHLRDALALQTENQKKVKLKDFYTQMLEDLDAGSSFFEVLQARKEFTQYEYYSVQIGEETGNLAKIIAELGSFFSGKNEQRRNLVNAMTYPIIILCTAILVVIFMLSMVVPMFEDIFKQNGVELPPITKGIIAFSNLIRDYGILMVLLGIGGVVAQRFLRKLERIQRKRDQLLLGIPYLGHFIKTVYLAQFTQAVALLTASRVPMLNSIQMVKQMIRFYPLRDALSMMEAKIVKGKALHESIQGTKIFDHKMAALIKVAEETNQTEYIFEKLNQQYAQEVQQRSKVLTTLMEPLIIVVIGLFVGVILVAMYLPMFKLSSVLG